MPDGDQSNTDELLEAREKLRAELAFVDALLEKELGSDQSRDAKEDRQSKRPVRAKVLDALDDFGWPAYTRQIRIYIDARTGDMIPPPRFGTLAHDEQKAFDSRRPRAVYLGFALTSARGEPIKRLLVRSDWELKRRIVAPTTGRVQHLVMTIRLCELALELGVPAVYPGRLKQLAADHARDLPGVRVRHGEFDLEGWHDLAKAELERLWPRDDDERAAAAAKLKDRPERALLFGLPGALEGGEHRVEPMEESG
ncbi:MAG: hypothetical protein WBM00_01550 [Solirubrobacterales bacterium]